ncbi:MAG: LLM class flavin-dependent oxidoreductase [Chloroflexi bacterium]|nr:MAG: LLM class flavin-dependent oxidoreductase [Chloroflexota bacterium]
MRIGVGLPTAIAGAPATLTPAWARRAEAAGFASLGVHDRLAYDSLEALTALAAAAAVTGRVRLAALLVVGPLRGGAAVLARQAATVAALAGSRLTLGLGAGPRRDDYEAAGLPFARRGRLLDAQLAGLLDRLPDGVEVVVGGAADAALARTARYAAGYCHGGGSPRAFRAAAERVLAAWSDAGRPGRPRLWGLGYFALGPGAAEAGRRDLGHYYAFTGAAAGRIQAGLLATPEAVAAYCAGYAEAGCDELVLFPTVAGLDQVDRLAESVARL